jgi:hypothetical protein
MDKKKSASVRLLSSGERVEGGPVGDFLGGGTFSAATVSCQAYSDEKCKHRLGRPYGRKKGYYTMTPKKREKLKAWICY